MLYVESTLANLSRLGLNFDAGDDEQTRLALMAKSQLDEAEAVVIREALARLAASKKDIDSFVESGYDMVHLESVVATLVSVRGGVQVVKLYRAAAVLLSFERFVRSVIDRGVEKGNVQNILETMADALISLEYYLSETELHGVAPPNILDIAEQSLSAKIS